jgi:hypothetical protein
MCDVIRVLDRQTALEQRVSTTSDEMLRESKRPHRLIGRIIVLDR